jgi:hypothetical protein
VADNKDYSPEHLVFNRNYCVSGFLGFAVTSVYNLQAA